MTADNGNGNGELRKLLEIKRAYRRDLASLEEDLRAKYERDLTDSKKRLKEQYLENVVDTVFAEPSPVKPVPKVAPAEASVSKADVPPRCPDCDAPVDPTDKFCAECSYPLKEDVKDDAPVVSAGGKFRKRRRS